MVVSYFTPQDCEKCRNNNSYLCDGCIQNPGLFDYFEEKEDEEEEEE